MGWLAFLFWVLLAGVFFAYAGYGLLLLALRPLWRRAAAAGPEEPVTVVIAAYNEAAILPAKIRNTLALDYPPGLLQVLVVADGSTDETAAALAPYPSVRLLHDGPRGGKTAALNRAMREVQTPFVVFSDANTELNPEALRLLVRHFGDPRTGAVAGEKRVRHSSGMGFAEGWYWHYESSMKALDAGFWSAVGAAGELFALRSALYRSQPPDTLLDDLALSLEVGVQGYRVAYEPGAYALEAPSDSLAAERTRKVRIAAGAYQLLARLHWRRLLRQPALAFQFIVRRWMRWVFCPLALLLLLPLGAALAAFTDAFLYDLLWAAQAAIYLLALAGALLLRRNRAFFLTTLPFYFLFMNACMLAGWNRWRKGQQSVLWEKARK
ncbi:glycosyltransferase family 2 protein [Flaviaesturariibacter flavus]|uniref:Glycosyltransferase family 2 protein n=1 Tax=Flaviaesturariibacter flavus TaxID=2502780 RepID=A0A4R1BBV6_9BACT|nr:glycosyltransferase family 2 protein [Flaviaesturariibacter flavus]TCJ14457.1 glycosyltransferase family 2 protein [Flaviaesturariibacter flavus]